LIDSEDEPEMIFESLNGRGKSLLQFDLLRNNLFLRTRISEEDRDGLYRDYWSHFETDYWEQKVKLGRRKVIISELFFQHFLMAKLSSNKVTPLFKVYQRQYRKQLDNVENSSFELGELSRYSKTYKEINDCSPESRIGMPMRFYKIFDITSLHPFVLYMENEGDLPQSTTKLVFRVLEAYTIRRMLCTIQGHKNYNRFFSEVIKKLKNNGLTIENLIKILAEQSANTTKWPNNYDVEKAFKGHWSELNINRNVIRYILYRIELFKREENRLTEKDGLPFKQFTLEHILPLKWQSNWLLPFRDDYLNYDEIFSENYKKNNPFWKLLPSKDGLIDESFLEVFELALERKKLQNSIGNLTVITGRLNSSMSNSAFKNKKSSLYSNSTLMLSKEICRHNDWDVSNIKRRENELCKIFCKLWPDAQWFADNTA